VAVPVCALAGVFAGYQAQQQPVDPVASSVASYNMHALAVGGGSTDVIGDSRLNQPSAAASSSARPSAHPSAAASGGTSGTRASSRSASAPAAQRLACSGTGPAGGTGMLPYNYVAIVNFLVAHGYTKLAAVGIAGNIYQESTGNPESVGSGGGGLIGWTPLPAGMVTGNVAADLQTQLGALLTYNQGWAQYIPMLNSATSPTGAAYIYMTYFERPGLPAAYNREGAAVAVAQACGIS
jgi:Phage tail lysozyme